MLELSLFKSRRFSLAILSAFLGVMAHYTVIFLVPFYLAFALHYSILKVGLVMAASPLGMLLMAPLSGTLSDRFGSRVFAVCGMCITALGLFLFSQLEESADVFDVVWRLVLTSAGIGMFQSPNNSTIGGSVPPQYLGITGSVISAMRNLGMVCGIAVAGAVLYAVAPVAASSNPDSFGQAEIKEFMSGLQWAFLTGAGLAFIAALTSFSAKERHRASVLQKAPYQDQVTRVMPEEQGGM